MTERAQDIVEQVLSQLRSQDGAATRELELRIARKRRGFLALVRGQLALAQAAATAPAAASDPWASDYRGWKITPVNGPAPQAGKSGRLITGYDVHHPQGGKKFVASIKEAKAHVDQSVGRAQDRPPVQPTPASAAPPEPRPPVETRRFDPQPGAIWINGVPAHLDEPLQAIVRDTVSDYVKPAQRLEMLADALRHGVNRAMLEDLEPPVAFNVTLPYLRASLQVVRLGVQLDPSGEVQVRTIDRQFPGPGSAVKPHELDLRAGSGAAAPPAAIVPPAALDKLAPYVSYERGRFLDSEIAKLSAAEKDAVDTYLVAIRDPLAEQPGTQEARIRRTVLGLSGQGPDSAVSAPPAPPPEAVEVPAQPQAAPALPVSPPIPTSGFDAATMAIWVEGIPVHLDEPLRAVVQEDVSEYITPAIRLEKLSHAIGYGVNDAIRAWLSPPVEFNVTLPYRRLSERTLRVRLEYHPPGDIYVSLVHRQLAGSGVKPHEQDLRSAPVAPPAPPLAVPAQEPAPDVPAQDVPDDEEDAQAPAEVEDTDTWTSNHLAYQGALLAQRDRGKGRARRLQAYGVGGVATKQRLSDLTPDEQQALMAAYNAAYDAPEPPAAAPVRSLGREDYQDRQQARQDRLESAADKAAAEARGRFGRADQISERFYMGQPILVGHHSEKGARRDQERMHDSMRAGITAQDRAKELSSRAASVGTGGISSDDPEALVQLRAKLAGMEKRRDSLKAVNAAYRKGGWEAVALLPNMAMTPERIAEHKATMAATPWEKMPIAGYTLTNLGANIRTVQKRIESLEKETRREGMPEIVGHGWRIEERADLNRIAVSFDKKPPPAVLALLRGWHYSRTENASLRLNNPSGRGAARYLAEQLAPHYPAPAAQEADAPPQTAADLAAAFEAQYGRRSEVMVSVVADGRQVHALRPMFEDFGSSPTLENADRAHTRLSGRVPAATAFELAAALLAAGSVPALQPVLVDNPHADRTVALLRAEHLVQQHPVLARLSRSHLGAVDEVVQRSGADVAGRMLFESARVNNLDEAVDAVAEALAPYGWDRQRAQALLAMMKRGL